ncbi:MAG: 50S ribosomal protein L32 [Armatimonadetes bacterium CG07_land_8_20_14_0_80_40_9]|nr:MAG: 50S ribosomal protein L32 [Armatimonadetes bacterium CG07_land_8_20_14_0_80_40_9]
MGLPKRKTSKSNRDSRRTHWKIEAPTLSECPRCHIPKLPYYACPSCGFYKGRQVIKIKEKKEK